MIRVEETKQWIIHALSNESEVSGIMRFRLLQLIVLASLLILSYNLPAQAHQPLLEQDLQFAVEPRLFLPDREVYSLPDPTAASLAIYGRLANPGEIDVYVFVPAKTEILPVSLLTPVRPETASLRPTLAIIGPDLSGMQNISWPYELPKGFGALLLQSGQLNLPTSYEPFSQERYFSQAKQSIAVSQGTPYYLLVFDRQQSVQDYVIGIGTIENFSEVSLFTVIKNIALIKLGVTGRPEIPWLDIFGIFVFCGGLALGTGYATIAAIQNGQFFPLRNWPGLVLALIGGVITYRQSWLSGTALFHLLLAGILFISQLTAGYKRRYVPNRTGMAAPASPSPAGILLALLCWWSALFLLVWYLLVIR